MKLKILIICLLLVSSCVYADYNVNRPEWKDFCPFGLENISGYNMQKSIVGTDKHWQIKEYNYWVDRKADFDKDLNICDELKNNTEKNQCYSKLVERQKRLNETTVTPWQTWQVKKMQIQQAGRNYQMYDAIKNQNINVDLDVKGKMDVYHW